MSLEEARYVLARDGALFANYIFDLDVEPFQSEMLRTAREFQRSVIECPAGHGKSTLMAHVLPVWELCANPNARIILIMKTEEDARFYANTIKNTFEENEKLNAIFGPFKSDTWSARNFNVVQRQINDPHYSLEIYGHGGPFLGHRSDLSICDDIVSYLNSITSDQRDKLKEKFELGIQTGPSNMWPYYRLPKDWSESSRCLKIPDGITWPKDINYERLVVCGTRFHVADLYDKLERDPSFKTLRFDCWKDAEQTQPLWPSKWSKQKLDKERASIGPVSFNKRYRNIALDESEIAFSQEWILGGEKNGIVYPGCLDYERSWGDHQDKWYTVLGLDPASGSRSRWATWPSYILLGTDFEESPQRFYLIDLFRKQVGYDDIIDVLLDGNPEKGLPGFRKLYNYDLAKVESNGYGTWLSTSRRMEDEMRGGLRVESSWTGRNKIDPESGVRAMQKIFEDGLVRIPYALPSDKDRASELIEQITTFPKGTTDYVMALWFCWLGCREQLKNTVAIKKSGNDMPSLHIPRRW